MKTALMKLLCSSIVLLFTIMLTTPIHVRDIRAEDLVGKYADISPAAPQEITVSTAPTELDRMKQEIIMKRESYRFYEIIGLCILSLFSLIISFKVIQNTSYTASDIVGACGINFIIFGTIILVMISDTEAQLTAAIGIIGAVAGYLFGSKEKVRQTAASNNDKSQTGDSKPEE